MIKVNENALAKVLDEYRKHVNCNNCKFAERCKSDTGEECANEVYRFLTEKPIDKCKACCIIKENRTQGGNKNAHCEVSHR